MSKHQPECVPPTRMADLEYAVQIAGPGSPKKFPLSYIRDPKRKAKVRQHAAAERTAAALTRTNAEQLKRLEQRGHGHCAEAARIRGRSTR